MKRKIVLTFLVLGVLQLGLLCQKEECKVCPTLKNLTTHFEKLTLTVWNTAGLRSQVASQDTLYKQSFGLELEIEFANSSVAHLQVPTCGLGFNTLLAGAKCPLCFEYALINRDPYDSLRILMTDIQTRINHNFTSAFRFRDKPLANLEDYLAKDTVTILAEGSAVNGIYKHRSFTFYLDLIDFKTVPNSAIFTVELFLRSGQKLSVKTEQINFYPNSQSL